MTRCQQQLAACKERVAELEARVKELEAGGGAPPVPSSPAKGIAAGGGIQSGDYARELDLIGHLGAEWIRLDVNWAQVQAEGPSSYNWVSDAPIKSAISRGMKVLAMIGYTPAWHRPAGTTDKYGPNPAAYAKFAGEAAVHYAALGVHHFEVWNEPNISGFWQPKPNPTAYTAILNAGYAAIKSADPAATVLNGGLSPAPSDGTQIAPVDFLKTMLANDAKFDALSHHPYCMPAMPGSDDAWSAWWQMEKQLQPMIGSRQVWATEWGAWTAGPGAVSEQKQAEMVTTAFEVWKAYQWAGPLFVYQHRDQGTDTSNRENFWGLARSNYVEKLGATAYRDA